MVGVILILSLMALAAINPRASIDKAFDAHRKKDLEDLKIAFENYYSDYACYPTQEQIENCNSDDLKPYLKEIPCDPITTAPYELVAEPDICPQNFITYTLLKRQQDPSADAYNCYSTNSPNATDDPGYDCTEYIDAFVPTRTPTESPAEEPTPTIPGIPYYYCQSVNYNEQPNGNCTELGSGEYCAISWAFPASNCNGACVDPDNVCIPQ